MTDAVPMETSKSTKRIGKRKKPHSEASGTQKRSKLTDMVFFDGNRNPAAVLHELRPDISPEKYRFEQEESGPKQLRFRCSMTIDENLPAAITGVGFGRSKQIAKNMAAQVQFLSRNISQQCFRLQQVLMQLYPTYRPPADAILSEGSDIHQQNRFVPSLPPSVNNDPSSLLDSIRKHLTTKSLSIKSPLQLFHELFINNQRLNSSTSIKNCVQCIPNDEHLVLVRVMAMDQEFWGVSTARSVAVNEACQRAIEALCSVSFREAKGKTTMNIIHRDSEISFR